MNLTEGLHESLASRLNTLFDVMHGPDTPPLSSAAAACAIAQKTGVAIAPDYLQQLRDGRQTTAPPEYLKAIAEFFGTPASYLIDPEPDPAIAAQLDVLKALRDNAVRDLRLCGSTTLSPQQLNALAATIRGIRS